MRNNAHPARSAPEWSDFRYFLAVARHGRLLAAGRALGVRHTTVARRIEALEQSLEGRLFHRTTRGWLLTTLGEALVDGATTMEEQAHLASARARLEATELAGRVRLATLEALAYAWLAPRLSEFHARHPRIVLEILTGDAQRDLSRGEADLAVRTPRPRQRELAAVCIAEGGVGIFGVGALARRARAAFNKSPPSGRGLPLGILGDTTSSLQKTRWFPAFAAEGSVRVEFSSPLALLAAGRTGNMLVVLPRFLARTEPSFVELTKAPLTSHRMWLVTHPEVRRDPRVRAVAEFVRSIAHVIDERITKT